MNEKTNEPNKSGFKPTKKKTNPNIKREKIYSTKPKSKDSNKPKQVNVSKNNPKRKKTTNFPNKRGETPLRVIPLGGMQEIGKNMFVYEYKEDMIIVDCGIGFPEENMPGIDIVIPDISYVVKNRSKLRGVFFTHGHEDHIGAVAWLTNEINDVPLYGSKLAIALIKSKLEDRGGSLKNVKLISIEDKQTIKTGNFSVEFIHSNHSIADANILAIRTPVGTVVHTGDFKIDFTPINGDPMDIQRLAEISRENPILLMCESTNAEKPGFSMSESKVGDSFNNIFEKANGRIIVATFSSNIYRMQQILTAAEKFGRKVCLIGRSVINVFNAANSLGYMHVKANTIVDINQISELPPNKVTIISTGSQGEPLAALTRMAFSEHRQLEISRGDTVILSSTPIPGNEKSIYRVINELYIKGANVIYASLAEVHASGHAYQEELKLMHQLVKSKYFVPMHGEARMLFQHSELVQKMGFPKENIFIIKNGDVLEVTSKSAKLAGTVPAGGILVDGSGFAEVGNLVLKERETLYDDGLISISIAFDKRAKKILGEPIVQTKGFVYASESDQIVRGCIAKINSVVNKSNFSNKGALEQLKSKALHDQVRDYLFSQTKRRPIILISVIEV